MIKIPTIQELATRVEDQLRAKLQLPETELKEVLSVVSAVIAAELKLEYLYISDVQRNLFPDTADLAEDGGELNRLGLIYLNRQPLPATDGKYIIVGTGTPGAVLRANLTFKSDDVSRSPGKVFVLDNQYTVPFGGVISIEVRSLESGLQSQLIVSDKLLTTEPIIGVENEFSVTSIIELPIEAEDAAQYRRAILDAIQLEPQGGAKTDYRLWAQDAQGVRKVYPYVKETEPGTVQIFVEASRESSTDGRGTPSSVIISNVRSVLNFDPDISKPLYERGRRPIQAFLEILPIQLVPVDITVYNLSQNNTSIQSRIRTAVANYLYTIRPFIDGGELISDKNDVLTSGKIQAEIVDVIGNENYFEGLNMSVASTSTNSYIFDLGRIPYVRNINYAEL